MAGAGTGAGAETAGKTGLFPTPGRAGKGSATHPRAGGTGTQAGNDHRSGSPQAAHRKGTRRGGSGNGAGDSAGRQSCFP